MNTKMVEDGAVLVLFNMLRAKDFNSKTRVLAMTTLANLTYTENLKADKIARAFAREGGVRLLVQILKAKANSKDKDLLLQTLNTLWNVCNIDEKNPSRFELENGLGTLVAHWNSHKDDPKFVHAVTGAVSAVLAQPDSQLVFREELNGLELTFGSMKTFLDNEKVQENLLCILVILSATHDTDYSRVPKTEFPDDVCQKGGLHTLIEVMRKHPDDVGIQENAAAVLFYLGQKSQQIRKPMLEAGAMAAVEAAIKRHPQSFALKELKKKLKIYKKGCVVM